VTRTPVEIPACEEEADSAAEPPADVVAAEPAANVVAAVAVVVVELMVSPSWQ